MVVAADRGAFGGFTKVPETRRWIFWSTRDSINAEVPSVTSIIETVLAVGVYWWIAVYFETYLPLLVSAAVAPLVLLRSEESVALGVNWFAAWERNIWNANRNYGDPSPEERRLALLIAMLVVLISGITAYFLTKYFLVGAEGWALTWRAFAIGAICGALGVIVRLTRMTRLYFRPLYPGLLAGQAALVSVMLGAEWGWFEFLGAQAGFVAGCSLMGIPLGVFTLSLIVRILATLRHIYPGVRSLPRNFRCLVLCTSPQQRPELVPGLTPGMSKFTRESALDELRKARHSKWYEATILQTFLLPAILLWFLPGWLYRVTLKSTAWFWWPLAFLGGDLRRAKHPNIFHWNVLGSLWAKTSIALAAMILITFFLTNFFLTGAVLRENPLLTPLGYFLVVDWSLFPWQILVFVIAVLSLVIVFLANDVGGKCDIATRTGDPELLRIARRNFGWIERIARFRLILAIALWILIAGQALLYFNSRKCWLSVPTNIQS